MSSHTWYHFPPDRFSSVEEFARYMRHFKVDVASVRDVYLTDSAVMWEITKLALEPGRAYTFCYAAGSEWDSDAGREQVRAVFPHCAFHTIPRPPPPTPSLCPH